MARFAKSYHFLTCFFTYPEHIGVFAVFAEYVGPQLIKQGSVSELMKQVRRTSVVKASVKYKGEVSISGKIYIAGGNLNMVKGSANTITYTGNGTILF